MKTSAPFSVAASRGLGWTAVVLAVVLVFGTSKGNAQNPSDDVHIMSNERMASGAKTAHPMPSSLMSVQVDLVLVPVTVIDSMSRPVLGLGKQDFAIYEDQKQQEIRYFSTEDAPISIGILLDVSGTMSNKIEAAREALAEFFKNAHPDDDYFVITFADRPRLLADSTRSPGDIQASLATLKPFGYTALLDAVQMGLAKLRFARYQRRALLIISDGGDNSSRHKMKDVKSDVEESGIDVYAIGLFDDGLPLLKSFDEKLGKRLLCDLTEASGGRTMTVENLAKLPEVAARISVEMRNRYLLGYQSTNKARDGKWRKIKVRVASSLAAANHQRLHPTYKKGYIVPAHP